MDSTTTPYEAGLDWTVAMNKSVAFIGQKALVKQREHGLPRAFIGFELSEGPVPRTGMELTVDGRKVGIVTSGTFSPILTRPLGMGYVEPHVAKPGTVLTLTVRSQRYQGTIVKLPFWKRDTNAMKELPS